MEPGIVILVFFVIIFLAVVIRLAAGSFDGDRVERYLQERGWTLVDRSWDPFGPGWFGNEDSRIYQIVYRDEAGRTHRAHVKTSAFSGVYLTNDQIVTEGDAPPPPPSSEEALAEENRRLKERIRELEQGTP